MEHSPVAFYSSTELAGVHAAKTTWFYQLGYLSAKTTPPLLELLATNSGHEKATDPSDKIFGFLGIAKETASKEITEINPLLRPRYAVIPDGKISFEAKLQLWEIWAVKVYIDLACYFIDTTKSLSILSYVYHTQSSTIGQECPSWVPRWNREGPRCRIWRYQDTDQTGFRAKGKLNLAGYSVQDRDGRFTLDLRGYEVYTVDKVSDILEEKDMKSTATVEQESSPDYRWIWKLNQLTECDQTQERGMKQESFILTAGRRGYGHNPMGNGSEEESSETEHLCDYAALITLLCRQELARTSQLSETRPLVDIISDIAHQAAKGNGVAFGEQAARACRGRRFFFLHTRSRLSIRWPRPWRHPAT